MEAGARWAPAFRALGDERLARMVEGGSEPAFAAVYGRYAPVLHGYCRSLLHDEEEAGDALNNAMLKALQAMRRAGRSGPLRPGPWAGRTIAFGFRRAVASPLT